MSRLFRSSLLLTAASMAVGLLVNPAAAYAADTTTNLTQPEMTVALQQVAATSTVAAKGGWRASMTIGGGFLSGTGSFVVDPVGGRAFSQSLINGEKEIEYAVQHKGTYSYLNLAASRSAVKMMGRPSVRFSFSAQKSLVLATYVKENLATPGELPSDKIGAGTKTVHDDGTADYVFDDDGTAVTLRLDAAGVLTKAQASELGIKVTVTYAYGAQRVTLPTAAVTVDAATLDKAEAYLTMPASVKQAAVKGAGHTRTAAKGKTVKVAALRKIVRKDVAAVNKAVHVAMIKVKNVTGGVRVYATNPWTHKTVAYTVKAAKKKVVVKKA